MAAVPKAQLYYFSGSVWASVPRLALIEKGYAPDDVELRVVDLLKAENWAPSYLRLNSKGTVPTLVVPLLGTMGSEVDTKFRAITNTREIVEFLDQSRNAQILEAKGVQGEAKPAPVLSPATIDDKAAADALIDVVYNEAADPNDLLLAARTAQELAEQRKGLLGQFCKSRLDAAQLYRSEAASSASSTENPRTQQQVQMLVKWYDDKIASLSVLNGAYVEADPTASEQFIESSIDKWKGTAKAFNTLEAGIQGPFILGEQLSVVDLHVGAWLARVISVSQKLAPQGIDPIDAMDNALKWEGLQDSKGQVGPKTRAYFAQLMARDSFKQIYNEGLH